MEIHTNMNSEDHSHLIQNPLIDNNSESLLTERYKNCMPKHNEYFDYSSDDSYVIGESNQSTDQCNTSNKSCSNGNFVNGRKSSNSNEPCTSPLTEPGVEKIPAISSFKVKCNAESTRIESSLNTEEEDLILELSDEEFLYSNDVQESEEIDINTSNNELSSSAENELQEIVSDLDPSYTFSLLKNYLNEVEEMLKFNKIDDIGRVGLIDQTKFLRAIFVHNQDYLKILMSTKSLAGNNLRNKLILNNKSVKNKQRQKASTKNKKIACEDNNNISVVHDSSSIEETEQISKPLVEDDVKENGSNPRRSGRIRFPSKKPYNVITKILTQKEFKEFQKRMKAERQERLVKKQQKKKKKNKSFVVNNCSTSRMSKSEIAGSKKFKLSESERNRTRPLYSPNRWINTIIQTLDDNSLMKDEEERKSKRQKISN